MGKPIRVMSMCQHAYGVFCDYLRSDAFKDCGSATEKKCCGACKHKLLSQLQNCRILVIEYEKEKK